WKFISFLPAQFLSTHPATIGAGKLHARSGPRGRNIYRQIPAGATSTAARSRLHRPGSKAGRESVRSAPGRVRQSARLPAAVTEAAPGPWQWLPSGARRWRWRRWVPATFVRCRHDAGPARLQPTRLQWATRENERHARWTIGPTLPPSRSDRP